MNRRSLLAGILATCTAPAFVPLSVLMRPRAVWVPPLVINRLQPLPATYLQFGEAPAGQTIFFRMPNTVSIVPRPGLILPGNVPLAVTKDQKITVVSEGDAWRVVLT